MKGYFVHYNDFYVYFPFIDFKVIRTVYGTCDDETNKL